MKDGVLHGTKVAYSIPMISYVFFADDNIIFSRATKEEASHILTIVKSYEAVSRQMINYKSKLVAKMCLVSYLMNYHNCWR